MSHATELLAAHRQEWRAMAEHPFVTEAAAGTLPSGVFERWLVEDYHFVVGFRRFLAGLVALSPTEHGADVLVSGLAALGSELDLFKAEAAARGLDLTQTPTLTTIGYTSYLLASLPQGWATAVTVLYGAEKAYFDSWSAVRTRTNEGSPYWRFIDNWSAPAFGAWVDDVADLVDALPRADHATFRTVVRFERAFWTAVHEDQD